MTKSSWKETLRAVDPAFRSPSLRFPLHIRGPLSLRLFRKLHGAPTRTRDGVVNRELTVERDGVAAIVHDPAGRPKGAPALVWIHGGGLVCGSAGVVNESASGLAAELGALVIAPEYRLAPEHPYPAAIDDCFDALRWLLQHSDELGIDPSRIAVGGESAGGGLAAVLAQRAHDVGISLRAQVLVSPMLDDRTVPRAESEGTRALGWTVPSNRYGWTSYLDREPGGAEERPYAAAARREDLSGLAPAWIMIGSLDLFYPETIDYASRLKQAGVPTDVVTIPGAHHIADAIGPDHPAIVAARSDRLEALRRAFR